jgi:hypothetical protein
MRFVRASLVLLAAAAGCAGNVLGSATGTGGAGAGGSQVSGSGGASSTSTSTTGSTLSSTSSGGTALSVCDCAAALNAGNTSCVSCQNAQCVSPLIACQASTCSAGTACVFGCGGQGPCIAGCIENNPAYATFIDCMFAACAPACAEAVPLTCPLPDGGADAAAD